jgi:LPXTG-motif cell wall-anchored protein
MNVSVGQTVSWSNAGQEDHTVTADDSSFDSGTLHPGAGFSHTFTTAGAFAYHCEFHPDDMKETIFVSGGGRSGPTGGGGGTSDGTTGPAGTTPSGTSPLSESAAGDLPGAAGGPDSLPSTGQDEGWLGLAGLALMAAGIGVRRRLHARLG